MLIKFGRFKPQYYRGILEKAYLDIHKSAYDSLLPHLNPDSLILDFGCGEGAFAQRLSDNGYKVHAADIDAKQFKAQVDQFIQMDLNLPVIADNFEHRYDVVIAMEIIEHLENPFKFIRDVKTLLKPGGILLLTTPNTSNFSSRIRFLLRGTLQGFEREDLSYGHIVTLNSLHLENIFSLEGMTVLKKKPLGRIPFFHLDNVSVFVLMRTILVPLFYFLMAGDKKGWCLGYILKKEA
jgi:2-polyprenyl-3-methyl-5-hydroxy-6-metoxy-1,4-benzoquinol methylase